MKKFILILSLAFGLGATAQNTCLPPSYFFNSKSRVTGNGGVNSQYRFNDVLPGINAYITITKIQNASIDSNTIDNGSSYPLAWQPFITFPSRRNLAGDSSYMEFKVEFKTATLEPVLLPQNCLAMTIVDCDGNGNNSYREFVKVTLPAKPMGVLNSTLSVFQDDKWVLFKSSTATFNNIDTVNKAAMGQLSFPSTGISSYSMRVGVIGPVSANTQRQFSFYFKSFAGLVVALPVELIDFKAQSVNSNVDLSWVSAKEDNFSHYEIYRSYNGHQFEYIGSEYSKSSSNGVTPYHFADLNALSTDLKSAYYRLRMVDRDGRSTWSHLVYVGSQSESVNSTFSLFPNPASSVLNISIEDPEMCESVVVKDVFGNIVIEKHIADGLLNSNIDVSELQSGLYVIVISKADGSVEASSFVKN